MRRLLAIAASMLCVSWQIQQARITDAHRCGRKSEGKIRKCAAASRWIHRRAARSQLLKHYIPHGNHGPYLAAAAASVKMPKRLHRAGPLPAASPRGTTSIAARRAAESLMRACALPCEASCPKLRCAVPAKLPPALRCMASAAAAAELAGAAEDPLFAIAAAAELKARALMVAICKRIAKKR